MVNDFTQQLALLKQPALSATLKDVARGMEKESLRITPDGRLSQQPHPSCLGSTLTHPHITTDYSEALLEFITPVFTDIEEALTFLEDIHRFTYECIGDEKLWVSSMPCIMGDELSIPIAEYGNSNSGRMKHIYRHGLWHRYGRTMQTIAGIHYNVSFSTAFWQQLHQLHENKLPLNDYIANRYFHMIRNFQRYVGMVVYLFGASPAVCASFLNGKTHNLETLNEHTLIGPYATSLRMSNLGYSNDAQSGLNISYNSLQEYVSTLTHAIRTPYQPYLDMGVRVGDDYKQLSGNILQIENEYYGNIRPKQTSQRGERPTVALERRGVEYIEMRCVDLDPFHPVGISPDQIRFLDMFAVFCLIQPGGPIDKKEQDCITYNNEAMVMRGRDPQLLLRCNGDSVNFHLWSQRILEKMQGIAELFDQVHDTDAYTKTLALQINKTQTPELTPSAQVLNHLRTSGESFFEFSMNLAKQHETYFRAHPLSPDKLTAMKQIAQQSLVEYQALEGQDTLSFDAYLARYFAE